MKKTILIVSSAVVFIVIALMIMVLGTTPFGVKPFKNEGGSLVYVKMTGEEELETGDTFLFYISDDHAKTATALARIINYDVNIVYTFARDVSTSEDIGFGNDEQLLPITFDSIAGKVVATIPLLGYISNYFSSDSGLSISIVLTVTFSLLIALSSYLPDEDEKKKKHQPRFVMQIPKNESAVYVTFKLNEEFPTGQADDTKVKTDEEQPKETDSADVEVAEETVEVEEAENTVEEPEAETVDIENVSAEDVKPIVENEVQLTANGKRKRHKHRKK